MPLQTSFKFTFSKSEQKCITRKKIKKHISFSLPNVSANLVSFIVQVLPSMIPMTKFSSNAVAEHPLRTSATWNSFEHSSHQWILVKTYLKMQKITKISRQVQDNTRSWQLTHLYKNDKCTPGYHLSDHQLQTVKTQTFWILSSVLLAHVLPGSDT
jgi:hypothetical protein